MTEPLVATPAPSSSSRSAPPASRSTRSTPPSACADECPVTDECLEFALGDQPGVRRLGRPDRGRAPAAPQGRSTSSRTRRSSPRRRDTVTELDPRHRDRDADADRRAVGRCASRSSPAARRSRAPARSRGRARVTRRAMNWSGRPAPSSRTSIVDVIVGAGEPHLDVRPRTRRSRKRVIDRVLHELVEHDRERRRDLARAGRRRRRRP